MPGKFWKEEPSSLRKIGVYIFFAAFAFIGMMFLSPGDLSAMFTAICSWRKK